MSVLSNIEFSILNTNLVKETEDSKKIKFKHESYLRIWKKYDSFCVETKEKMSPKFSNLPEQTEVKQPIGPENIVVHIKNRTYEKKESQQEKLKDLSDIKDIVKDEPIKKVSKRKNKKVEEGK